MTRRARIGLVIGALLLLLAAGGVALRLLVFPPPEPVAPEVVALEGAEFPSLPDDPRKAKKELERARRELTKLRPKGEYIVINTHANIAQMRRGDEVVLQGVCSTGSGRALTDSVTGNKWIFDTPHGVFRVQNKLTEPIWRKPDWAFVEEGERPPKDVNERYDENVMGEYAMGIGNGYFIHGTIYERLLGISVTHGCVRLGSEDLKKFYDRTKPGTPVYIF